ncbi:NAD(P)/FAD-dependent oxidoreductase [Rhodococcus opacus]|uniref:NAD(P)/FAD-dependent oxidoreductase n=1 Tax=Rhodococcus opacus TaxID=37919 RepID=UPI002954802D|nr:FAD-dependent oxidoreductase [Rhodococcus opacus]
MQTHRFTPEDCIVIVGTGQAGHQAAVSLREQSFAGRIVLIGDEPDLPYQRPPLSKGYLAGHTPAEALPLRPEDFYSRHGIELLTGNSVTSIIREECRVVLCSGKELDFTHLILAVGTEPRSLTVPGGKAQGVFTLKTPADADSIRERLRGPSQNVVIIGGGFIGMEVAATAAASGHNTAVVETSDRIMRRAVDPAVSSCVAREHRSRGVALINGAAVVALTMRDGAVSGVELDTGALLRADTVVAGIGVEPNVALAQASDLAISNGIVVDDQLLTDDPHISAIGDCANYPSVHAGRRVRLESVQNAVDHARHVARRLMHDSGPYASVPWFWTHQFDLNIQIAGIASADDSTIVHGDSESSSFSVLRFRNDLLTCVESINRPSDHLAARKILTGACRPSFSEVLAPDFTLKSYAKSARNHTDTVPA